LDEEADPCQDMVQFACGKWFEDNEIPPSENRWGVFGELEAKISSTLHGKYVKLVTINSVIAFKVIYYLKINIYK
jgi:endothelin-converting enzyme/putative endopeptidase